MMLVPIYFINDLSSQGTKTCRAIQHVISETSSDGDYVFCMFVWMSMLCMDDVWVRQVVPLSGYPRLVDRIPCPLSPQSCFFIEKSEQQNC
jgi:hypothetical protein